MMKRLMYLNFLILALVIESCSSDDDSSSDNGGSEIPDTLVSGELFGEPFTGNGSSAYVIETFDEERLSVFLSSEDVGCETNQFSEAYTITISGPRTEGSTNDVFVSFSDPNSEDFITVGSGIDYEIISITQTEIEAKIRVNSSDGKNNLEGKFTAPICSDDEG
ncbi:hypothetical protein ACFFGL_12265 [Mesonia maritima]